MPATKLQPSGIIFGCRRNNLRKAQNAKAAWVKKRLWEQFYKVRHEQEKVEARVSNYENVSKGIRNMTNTITIKDAVKQMLAIVERLARAYPQKKFTLDGRLVGDIGEVLVEEAYAIKLYEDVKKQYDGETSDGRLVQIKATMKKSLTFPADHVPNYYIGVQISADGSFIEVFNGPGIVAWEAVKNRAPLKKSNLYSIPITTLAKLQANVSADDRIPRREGSDVHPKR
jgi:hypothetical protein